MKKLLVMLCAVFAGVPAVANEFIVGQSIDLSGRGGVARDQAGDVTTVVALQIEVDASLTPGGDIDPGGVDEHHVRLDRVGHRQPATGHRLPDPYRHGVGVRA